MEAQPSSPLRVSIMCWKHTIWFMQKPLYMHHGVFIKTLLFTLNSIVPLSVWSFCNCLTFLSLLRNLKEQKGNPKLKNTFFVVLIKISSSMDSWHEAKLQGRSLKCHKYCTEGAAFSQVWSITEPRNSLPAAVFFTSFSPREYPKGHWAAVPDGFPA